LRLDNSASARLATGRGPSSVTFPFFHALHELLGDVLSALMVAAAVWQSSADFLKHYVQIRGRSFIGSGHLTPQLPMPINRRSISS